MSTFTVSGPLRYCRCGHAEHMHEQWLFACPFCACTEYKRAPSLRGVVPGSPPKGDTDV